MLVCHRLSLLILHQAKFFTESRLLQRYVRVQLLSLPNASATPFQTGANATAPPPASIFIGTGMTTSPHPNSHNLTRHLSSPAPGR